MLYRMASSSRREKYFKVELKMSEININFVLIFIIAFIAIKRGGSFEKMTV